MKAKELFDFNAVPRFTAMVLLMQMYLGSWHHDPSFPSLHLFHKQVRNLVQARAVHAQLRATQQQNLYYRNLIEEVIVGILGNSLVISRLVHNPLPK
jgi:hypothetical protein